MASLKIYKKQITIVGYDETIKYPAVVFRYRSSRKKTTIAIVKAGIELMFLKPSNNRDAFEPTPIVPLQVIYFFKRHYTPKAMKKDIDSSLKGEELIITHEDDKEHEE